MAITPEKRQAIVAALTTERNASLVARQIGGVSVTTVWHIAQNEKIALDASRLQKSAEPELPEPISSAQRKEIVAALKANPRPTVGVIAQQAGVRRVTVWRVAAAEKIDLSKSAAPATTGNTQENKRHRFEPIPQDTREKIIAALKVNPNSAQVARMIGGVGQSTVAAIAKNAGVELTAGKELQRRIFGQKKLPNTTIPHQPRLDDLWRSRTQGAGLTVTVAGEEKQYIELAAVPVLAKKKIADTFIEAADLFGGVARNMLNREFRGELLALVRKFDKRPGGVD